MAGRPTAAGVGRRRATDRAPRKSPTAIRRAARIYELLSERYPDARCALEHRSALELLIATILSAQCTDVAVNRVTPVLFAAFPTPHDYAAARPEQIEPYIRTLGLFRGKAKSIQSAMSTIVREHGGRVPATMEELLALRGVARKTANVVLGNAYNIKAGIVVDTHVARLSRRFGLSRHDDPAGIERDLMALYPSERWTMLSHLLISHGRQVCRARGARCAEDAICREFCANARHV
jgi:endonuclease III